jgi:hypothetical protein
MSTTTNWLNTKTAVDSLGMSRSKLHELKRAGEFKPGEHWIKAGGAHGRLLWNIPSIRQWQIDTTAAVAEASTAETYDGLPDAHQVMYASRVQEVAK